MVFELVTHVDVFFFFFFLTTNLDLKVEKEDEQHARNEQAEIDLEREEVSDVKDARATTKEKPPGGEMIVLEVRAEETKAAKAKRAEVEKTRKGTRTKVSFHRVWDLAGGENSSQENYRKAHREGAAQGADGLKASKLAVIEEDASVLKLECEVAKGITTKNEEPKVVELTEVDNIVVADKPCMHTAVDMTNVTGIEERDAGKLKKEKPVDKDAIEVPNASGGEVAEDGIPKLVDKADLIKGEQDVTKMTSTTDGETASAHPIHADVAYLREALNTQQQEDVETVETPSVGEAEKFKVPKAECKEKVQRASTGYAGATYAKEAKIKGKDKG